ncbi:MAG: hypothetical protein NTW10_05820 [Bacteroidetes bacterium]|nr:hypothetical protein [Bacteroidota bacterium]
MKNFILRILLVAQFLIIPIFLATVFADEPGPPGPGGDPGPGGTPVGAPIDSAVIVLIAMGIFYGCYKIYRIRKEKTELKEEGSIQHSKESKVKIKLATE